MVRLPASLVPRQRNHRLPVGGYDRSVSRDTLLRVAHENDVKNAASIILQVTDSVMSFEAMAEKHHIEKSVSEIVLKYVSNQIEALD